VKGTAAVLAALAVLGVLYRDFLADDAYITLAFARHLVQDGAPSLGGEAVYGFSSPLWFALSAVLFAVFGTEGAPVALKLASAAGTGVCAALVFALARRLTDERRLHALAVVLLLADAWIGRWAWSGMEASWAAAAAVFGLLLREQRKGLEGALLLAFVGVQIRPELGLLALLLVVDAALRRERPAQGGVRLPVVAGLGMALVLGWLVLAQHWFGGVEPRSVVIKAGAWGRGDAAVRALQVICGGQAVALGLLALGGRAALRRAALPLAWLVVLTAFYVVQGYEPLSRYLVVGLACLPAHAASGTAARYVPGGAVAAVAVGLAITLGLLVPASTGDRVRFYRDVVEEIEPDASLATWEIGALGYYGDLALVDLGGLTLNRALLPLVDRPRRLLRETRPRYSLLRYDIDGLRWNQVLSREVRSTRAAARGQPERAVLWELDWADVPP
jgi:hypothetical protein